MPAGGGRVSKGDDIDSGGREEAGEKRTRTGKENRYGKQTGKRRERDGKSQATPKAGRGPLRQLRKRAHPRVTSTTGRRDRAEAK
ncbi:hypothetical protein K438DRAFT_488796 [Mycena galopus ATCC 62051]|nr:hypothetical protein K438DRAFT_488796 [Mycena galopus ATCC 62051]